MKKDNIYFSFFLIGFIVSFASVMAFTYILIPYQNGPWTDDESKYIVFIEDNQIINISLQGIEIPVNNNDTISNISISPDWYKLKGKMIYQYGGTENINNTLIEYEIILKFLTDNKGLVEINIDLLASINLFYDSQIIMSEISDQNITQKYYFTACIIPIIIIFSSFCFLFGLIAGCKIPKIYQISINKIQNYYEKREKVYQIKNLMINLLKIQIVLSPIFILLNRLFDYPIIIDFLPILFLIFSKMISIFLIKKDKIIGGHLLIISSITYIVYCISFALYLIVLILFEFLIIKWGLMYIKIQYIDTSKSSLSKVNSKMKISYNLFCPRCYHNNAEIAVKCEKCGYEMHSDLEFDKTQIPNNPFTYDSNTTKYSKESDITVTKLSDSHRLNLKNMDLCPVCGYKTEPGLKNCSYCGTELK